MPANSKSRRVYSGMNRASDPPNSVEINEKGYPRHLWSCPFVSSRRRADSPPQLQRMRRVTQMSLILSPVTKLSIKPFHSCGATPEQVLSEQKNK